MRKVIECTFSEFGIGKHLSNLYPHEFTFRDLKCASMEGLLQSFKFADTGRASELRKMSGVEAWKEGQKGNGWQKDLTLYMHGQRFNRMSQGYYNLIKEAYDSIAQTSLTFRGALLMTEEHELAHTIGHHDPRFTVLTVSEFLHNLNRVRSAVRSGEFPILKSS